MLFFFIPFTCFFVFEPESFSQTQRVCVCAENNGAEFQMTSTINKDDLASYSLEYSPLPTPDVEKNALLLLQVVDWYRWDYRDRHGGQRSAVSFTPLPVSFRVIVVAKTSNLQLLCAAVSYTNSPFWFVFIISLCPHTHTSHFSQMNFLWHFHDLSMNECAVQELRCDRKQFLSIGNEKPSWQTGAIVMSCAEYCAAPYRCEGRRRSWGSPSFSIWRWVSAWLDPVQSLISLRVCVWERPHDCVSHKTGWATKGWEVAVVKRRISLHIIYFFWREGSGRCVYVDLLRSYAKQLKDLNFSMRSSITVA